MSNMAEKNKTDQINNQGRKPRGGRHLVNIYIRPAARSSIYFLLQQQVVGLFL